MIDAKELGIRCIKFDCHNKSNEGLEKLIYDFQDLMYYYANKKLSLSAKNDIMKSIEKLGTKAKDIECDEKVEPRKQEFLANMRKIYKNVRNADIDSLTVEDTEYMIKLMNYSIALGIKAKNSGDKEILLKQLSDNKKTWEIYLKPFTLKPFGDKLNVYNFKKLQAEMLGVIGSSYGVEDVE